MKAAVFNEFGGPEVLRLEEVGVPEPGQGEALVRVRAVSVGRTLDLAARAGRIPFARIEPPHILGADNAGVVEAFGPGAGGFAIGERVATFPAVWCGECRYCRMGREDACASLQVIGVHRQGAYAQYVVVPVRNLHRIPDGVTDVEASALGSSGPVSAHQLAAAGGVEPGRFVLVLAGASALGSMTAMYAIHLGARVVVTSRTPEKLAPLLAAGAEAALDPGEDGFVDTIMELTGGEGVDIVVDNVGASAHWDKAMAVLGVCGVVVSSGGFVDEPLTISIRQIYTKAQRIVGIRTGNAASIPATWREVKRGLRPLVDRTFPLADAREAHRYVELDQNVGRVALIPPE